MTAAPTPAPIPADALIPVLTNAGLAACVNASNSGLAANLAQIGVGQGIVTNGIGAGYTPLATATALQSEVIRVPLITGSPLPPAGFQVLAQVPASSLPTQYTIWEVGFYLDTGVLLALWSTPSYPLAVKTALADVDIAFDLILQQLPFGSLSITVQEPAFESTLPAIAELLAQQANLFTQALKINQRLIAAKI